MKKKSKGFSPRNHVALALLKRQSGGGAHRKTQKALRRSAKMALMSSIKE